MLDLPPLFADLHPSKDQHRIWEPTRLSFISWIIGTVKNFPSRNYLLLSQCKLIIAIIILIWDNFSKYTLSIKLGWSNTRNEIKLIKTSVTDCVFSITNNILRWNCNWWQVGVKYYYWTLKLFSWPDSFSKYTTYNCFFITCQVALKCCWKFHLRVNSVNSLFSICGQIANFNYFFTNFWHIEETIFSWFYHWWLFSLLHNKQKKWNSNDKTFIEKISKCSLLLTIHSWSYPS